MAEDCAPSSRYKVPSGFRTLLEALAREVLRAQPDDIYDFSALFFQELQRHRRADPDTNVFDDTAAYDSFREELHAKASGKPSNNNDDEVTRLMGAVELRNELRPVSADQVNRPKSPLDDAAVRIQAAFRGHMVRHHPDMCGLSAEKLSGRRRSNELLAVFDTKKDVKKEPTEVRRHSIGYTGDFNTPESRAATKIQAEIRGFLTRRRVSEMKKHDDDAAVKIQSHIRGFLTRKHLDQQGLLPHSHSGSSLHSNEVGKLGGLPELGEEQDAATKIQAQVKGFLARKELQREKNAATKIQAVFRGHHVRRDIDHLSTQST